MPFQPNHLSVLGIIHTAISVLALFAAFYALFKEGKINPLSGPGKLYVLLTVITCLTALPIMKTGHFTAAHGVAVIILVLLPVGVYAGRILKKNGDYLQVIAMSTTMVLSCIPAVVETLTRLPISHPIANGPADPFLTMCLNVLFALYLTGLVYQIVKIRSRKKAAKTADSSVKLT